MTHRIGRRSLLTFAVALFITRRARGDVSVPAALQAQLIGKIAAFDRNFPARAMRNGLVLVVQRAGDDESARNARAISAALRDLSDIGGFPKTVEVIAFGGAAALADISKERRPAIIYLATGLEGESPAIAGALAGGDVLTVGASGAFAETGTNVGFDLEGSRPKIVVNLPTSRAQNVDFKADLLRLARVIRG